MLVLVLSSWQDHSLGSFTEWLLQLLQCFLTFFEVAGHVIRNRQPPFDDSLEICYRENIALVQIISGIIDTFGRATTVKSWHLNAWQNEIYSSSIDTAVSWSHFVWHLQSLRTFCLSVWALAVLAPCLHDIALMRSWCCLRWWRGSLQQQPVAENAIEAAYVSPRVKQFEPVVDNLFNEMLADTSKHRSTSQLSFLPIFRL